MTSLRRMLRCKIHRATVTHADLAYEGSISLSPELLQAAGIAEFEAVNLWNVTNGNRIETYAIRGEAGTSDISVNGAAAHLFLPGDVIIIAAFGLIPEAEVHDHRPTVVFVDENNRVKSVRPEVPGPARHDEHGAVQ